MTASVGVLLVARPGPLADGLWAVLSTIPEVGAIDQVSDLASALSVRLESCPAVVLLDLERSGDEALAMLGQVKARWPGTRCLVLVDAVHHQEVTESAGADAVFVKGRLAGDLVATVERLLARPCL